MQNRTSSVLLAASLAAVASAQQASSFDGFQSSAPTPSPAVGGEFGGGGYRAGALTMPRPALQQDQPTDYSLRGLFMNAHGDFMLKRERYNPQIELSGQLLPDSELQHEQGDFDLVRAAADMELPFMVSSEGYILAGAFYESRHYAAQGIPGFADETVYSAGAKLGFGVFLDENMLLEASVEPGLWSDYDGTPHHEDFDMPSKVLLTIRSDTDLFFMIGARYNEIYEDANLLPYLGIAWQLSESFRIDVLLPDSIECSLWPTPDFGFLLGGEAQGAEYRVRSSAATGNEQGDLRAQEILVYGGAIWRLSDLISLSGRIGVAVAGDYTLEDGLASTAPVNGTLESNVYFEMMFGIDF